MACGGERDGGLGSALRGTGWRRGSGGVPLTRLLALARVATTFARGPAPGGSGNGEGLRLSGTDAAA